MEEAISNTPRSARNQYTTQVQKHITEATDAAKKLAVELKNKREKRRRPQTDEPESEAPPAKQARPDRNVMKEMAGDPPGKTTTTTNKGPNPEATKLATVEEDEDMERMAETKSRISQTKISQENPETI